MHLSISAFLRIPLEVMPMSSPVANSSSSDAPRDERRTPRERTFLPARIAFGDGGALSTQCTVTHLSSTGARLIVPASISLPDRFDIAIPQRGLDSRARLVWRKDDQAGVEFEQRDEPKLDMPPEDLQARIRDLEAINTKLRAQIAELTQQVARLTET
jgi:hypothetical protein